LTQRPQPTREHTDTDIAVANVRGPGASRFLARALADALASDLALVAIDPTETPRGSAVEFVFAGDAEVMDEVIRAGRDATGRVKWVELVLRRPAGPRRPYPNAHTLRDAIGSVDAITTLDWGTSIDGTRLCLTLQADHRLHLLISGAGGDK
jgi:hypothetical protein